VILRQWNRTPVPHSQVQLRAPFSHDTIAGDISDYEDAVLDPNDDVFERSPCNSPEINSPMAGLSMVSTSPFSPGRRVVERIAPNLDALFWGLFAYIGFDVVSNVAKGESARFSEHRPMGAVPCRFQRECCCSASAWLFFLRRTPTPGYIFLLLVQFAWILLFLRIYCGGV
jgi:hypothetical protein